MAYTTGLRNVLVNESTVRPNQPINIVAAVAGFPQLLSASVTSSPIGSFRLPFTIPIEQASRPITWTFTEVNTSTVVIRNDTTPQFDPNIFLSIDSLGTVIGGQGSITGTVKASQGYDLLIELIQGDGSVASSQTRSNFGPINRQVFSLPVPVNIKPGPYLIRTSAALHKTLTVPLNAVILEGVTINNIPGLVYPGRPLTITGTGPQSQTITVNAFGTNYSVVVNGSKTWSLAVSAPLTAGTQTITATTVDGAVSNLSFTVATVSLTLNSCPLVVQTNSVTGLSFSGTLLPTKQVTAAFTGIDQSPVVVSPDPDGSWQFSINPDWQDQGSYTITFSSPGETSIVCSGSTTPRLRFTPSNLTVKQGDSAGFVQVRGLPLANYFYNISGALTATGAVLTNSLGVAQVPIPAVPQLVQTNSLATLAIGSTTLPISVEAEIPGTINIPTPSAIVGSQKILWTNGSYDVTGSISDSGIFNLLARGVPGTITINTVGANSYGATLATSASAGFLDLILDIYRQPSVSERVIISPPISFSIPNRILKGPALIPINITSDAGELIQLTITGSVDGVLQKVVDTVPGGGTYTYNLDTSQLSFPQELSFEICNQYFCFLPQTRQVSALSDLEPPLNLSINISTNNVLFNPNRVFSGATNLDSSVVNEAGYGPYGSLLEISWAAPASLIDFDSYLIEKYNLSTGQWDALLTTNSNKLSPVLANDGYRVTPKYFNQYGNIPFYIPPVGGFLSKSASMLELRSSTLMTAVSTPPGASFFVSLTSLSYTDSQATFLNISSSLNQIITPPGASFFVSLTSLSYTEIVLTSLNSSTQLTQIITPQGTPFFTV